MTIEFHRRFYEHGDTETIRRIICGDRMNNDEVTK